GSGGVRRCGRSSKTFNRPRSQPLGQLSHVKAVRIDEFIECSPRAVADKLPPTADRPVIGLRRRPAGDDWGRALPKDAIRRGPAGAFQLNFKIRERKPASVHRDVIVEDAAGPAFDWAAEAVSPFGLAINKRVGAGGQRANGKVVPAVFGRAVMKEAQLPG